MARRRNASRRVARTKGVSEIFHSKMSRKRQAFGSRLAARLTAWFGTVWFLSLNALAFGGWIFVNVGGVPGLVPFDPYPFHFLTLFISIEVIFLTVVVLISQNQASRIADIREQVGLQVNVQAEKEVTKILHLLDRVQRKLGMDDGKDAELAAMKRVLDLERLEEQVLEDMRKEQEG
jgi:uncharacterized membrane protein